MSVYDDINYKSKSELDNKKLPTNEIQKDFQNEFTEIFSNLKTSELKDMMYLNNDEREAFDFINNKQEFIDNDYFKKLRMYDKNFTPMAQMDYLTDYLEQKYEVITPENIKEFFSEIMGGNIGLSDEDFREMIYMNFNKYQVNLKVSEDKESFKNFLNRTMEDEQMYIKSMLPDVQIREPSYAKKEGNLVNRNSFNNETEKRQAMLN